MRRLSHTFFIPIAIGLVAVIATVWYEFVWVPSQTTYFEERYLRQLAIMENQIKRKIEGFDSIMDKLAGDGSSSSRSKVAEEKEKEIGNFFDYLNVGMHARKFAEVDEDIQKAAHDPPSVKLKADEGTYVLYLAYNNTNMSHGHAGKGKGKGTEIFAESKVDDLLDPFVSGTENFDAILVAQADGRVIFQRASKSAPSGLEFTRIDDLLKGQAKESPKDKDKQARSDEQGKEEQRDKSTLESLLEFSGVSDVTLAGKKYLIFSQPIHLSFPTVDSVVAHRRASTPAAAIEQQEEKPEEWVLCGVVSSERFKSDSLAVSYSNITWLSAVLLLFLLSYPFLKVVSVGPKGRLRHRDSVLPTISAFLGTGLMILLLLHLYHTHQFQTDVQGKLESFAHRMNENVRCEEDRIWHQLACLGPDKSNDGVCKQAMISPPLHLTDKICQQPTPLGGNKSEERPYNRTNILVDRDLGDVKKNPYPYFQVVSWINRDGWQRIKWDTRKRAAALIQPDYSEKLKFAYEWGEKDPQLSSGILPLYSPVTGQNTVSFWKMIDPTIKGPACRPRDDGGSQKVDTELIGMSIGTRPLSLIQPVTPPSIQYAVVDNDGLVLFHSDPARNLNENFLDESEGNTRLSALIKGRGCGDLTVNYLGRPHQAYVTPLVYVTASGGTTEDRGTECNQANTANGAANSPWSLVVFQDSLIQETMILETMTLASILYLLYGGMLAGLWGFTYLFWKKYPKKWFWPDRDKGAEYWRVTVCNVVLLVALFTWIFAPGPIAIVRGMALIALIFCCYLFWGQYPKKRSSPSRNTGAAYTVCDVLLGVLFLVVLITLFCCAAPLRISCGAVLIPLVAILSNFRMIADSCRNEACRTEPGNSAEGTSTSAGSSTSTDQTGSADSAKEAHGLPTRMLKFLTDAFLLDWRTEYISARVSLLALIAILPSLAFFRVAYNFENELLIKRDQIDLFQQLDSRIERIKKTYENVWLPGDNDGAHGRDFIKRRTDKTLFDIHVAPPDFDITSQWGCPLG